MTGRRKYRIGVLGSGKGSNLLAIAEACASGAIPVEIAVVVSDVPNAGILNHARDHGVPACYLDPGPFRTKPEHEKCEIMFLDGEIRPDYEDKVFRLYGEPRDPRSYYLIKKSGVADNGTNPVRCSLGQEHVRRDQSSSSVGSYRENMLAAVDRVGCEKVVVLEDDDWYGPRYVSTMAQCLDVAELAGMSGFFLYNVCYRRYREWNETAFTCMSHTAFRRTLIPKLRELIVSNNTNYPDVLLWREQVEKRVWVMPPNMPAATVGIKGMPGRLGISFGHRPHWTVFSHDPDGSKLRELIGQDA